MICEQGGLHAMAQKNSIGITPSKYLASNPYADVDEMKLISLFLSYISPIYPKTFDKFCNFTRCSDILRWVDGMPETGSDEIVIVRTLR